MLDSTLYADDRHQPYYTEDREIGSFMGKLLGDVTDRRVLEPAVGQGAFLAHLQGTPDRVDAVDVDTAALAVTRSRYPSFVRTICTDFIGASLSDDLFGASQLDSQYDAIISNPPYGLRFSTDYRKTLKQRLGAFYVRESYGLFLRLSLDRLRLGGRYVFIVPDTFLTSVNHTPLRHFLANNFCPTHLVLLDSKRFGGVQFGYGSFCILAGHRAPPGERVHWADLRKKPDTPLAKDLAWETVTSSELIASVEHGWSPPSRRSGVTLPHTLADYADCKTGIYTGDNAQFLGYDPSRLQRRANGHPIDWLSQVHTSPVDVSERLNGVQGTRPYVPLIRGGHREPFENTFWAIKWDAQSIHSYRTYKKARFQNSSFYFREGIAIPMVTSGRLTASYMNHSVFDQGVVGVFPHNPAHLNFLLLFLNSSFVTTVLKGSINPSANNSAKYIARIPIPVIDDQWLSIASSALSILRLPRDARTVAIDNIFKDITSQNTFSPR